MQVELVDVVDHGGQRVRQGDQNDGDEEERVPQPDDDCDRDRGQRSRDDGVDREEDVEEEAGGGRLLGAAQEVVKVRPLEDLQAEGPRL